MSVKILLNLAAFFNQPLCSSRRRIPLFHASEAEGVAIITFNLIRARVVLEAKKESNTLCLRRVIKLADIKGGEALIKEINHLAKASKASERTWLSRRV